MPSSISSSSRPRVERAIWLLLAGCLLIGAAVEGIARVGFHRASKIQRRFIEEYARAHSLGAGDRSSNGVLVVGNSLLLEGVRFDQLQQTLSSEWRAERLVLERTAYYDWYYGLKRLLQEGARPRAVIVVLTARSWIENEFRGDFAAHYLFSARDLIELSHEVRLSSTELASSFVAHVSEFWAERAELRNFLLRYLVPDMERLTNVFTKNPQLGPLQSARIEPLLRIRIARLRDLLEAHGAHLVLVVPPTPPVPGNDGWLGVVRAARSLNVSMIEPLPADTFSPEEYRDGFHLNDAGAARYTSLLVPELREALRATRNAPVAERTTGRAGSAAPTAADN